MSSSDRGMVAAGHPATAHAGVRVLQEGGNAVDAAVAACLTSWAAEPLLTGPGAGGYMLVAGGGVEPVLLDFFVAAPSAGERSPLIPVEVDFGDATQSFNCGAATCGVYGNPAGLAEAAERWGTVDLADLAAPAAALARDGIAVNFEQAYLFDILGAILTSTPEAAAIFAPSGRLLSEGEEFRCPELGDTIERFGREGAEPFYRGDIAGAVAAWLAKHGGTMRREDLAAYRPLSREPAAVRYRGRRVLTNPPPSAGGTLLALALGRLEAGTSGPPSATELVDVMQAAQHARTPEFDAGLAQEGFLERFLAANLGSTTHISVLDSGGLACSVTCTNGEGSGMVVPGTGIHVNNVMGEEDLNPLGFFSAPAGRRMPSMMAPTVVMGEGGVELVVGSAGSNRIRSALLQVIVGVVDRGLDACGAVEAPRLHFEHERVFAEPGIDIDALAAAGWRIVPFGARNLFFGGAQAVQRDAATGRLTGAGDPRRGGVAIAA